MCDTLCVCVFMCDTLCVCVFMCDTLWLYDWLTNPILYRDKVHNKCGEERKACILYL